MERTLPDLAALDETQFRRLAQDRLLETPPEGWNEAGSPSDYDLNPDARNFQIGEVLRPAAVLIPILIGNPLRVLLTERTDSLPSHAGQIAFPGGKIDNSDSGPLEAAVREAYEEVGLERRYIEPVGYVEPYRTGTGFLVTPVVAMVRHGFSLTPDPREVASVFEVPLSFLLDTENHRIDTVFWRGAERRFYAMPYEGRYIWGATAGIIRALHRRLSAP